VQPKAQEGRSRAMPALGMHITGPVIQLPVDPCLALGMLQRGRPKKVQRSNQLSSSIFNTGQVVHAPTSIEIRGLVLLWALSVNLEKAPRCPRRGCDGKAVYKSMKTTIYIQKTLLFL